MRHARPPVPRLATALRGAATVLAAALVVACGVGGSATPDPFASFAGASLTIRAVNISFEPDIATLPASQPIRLVLDNQDAGTAHNLHVFQGDTDLGTSPTVTGPGLAAIELPALAPGRYQFSCTIHSNMIGTLLVQAGGVAGPSTPEDTATPDGSPSDSPASTASAVPSGS